MECFFMLFLFEPGVPPANFIAFNVAGRRPCSNADAQTLLLLCQMRSRSGVYTGVGKEIHFFISLINREILAII